MFPYVVDDKHEQAATFLTCVASVGKGVFPRGVTRRKCSYPEAPPPPATLKSWWSAVDHPPRGMANRLQVGWVRTIEALLERGPPQRRIAEALGVDRAAVARYTRAATPRRGRNLRNPQLSGRCPHYTYGRVTPSSASLPWVARRRSATLLRRAAAARFGLDPASACRRRALVGPHVPCGIANPLHTVKIERRGLGGVAVVIHVAGVRRN